jgi:hypothetical protein
MVRVAQYSWYDFYEFLYVEVLAGKLVFSFQFWREYAWEVVLTVCPVLFLLPAKKLPPWFMLGQS